MAAKTSNPGNVPKVRSGSVNASPRVMFSVNVVRFAPVVPGKKSNTIPSANTRKTIPMMRALRTSCFESVSVVMMLPPTSGPSRGL
ncbi:MAG: hypothetical protein BWY63_02515 [Chloroflexi bacterium ADurb.Bin360]|nr:MAG: hypothetical protein BWY63_02515 [Chloroflexi bacterium ADurb.Bin360]